VFQIAIIFKYLGLNHFVRFLSPFSLEVELLFSVEARVDRADFDSKIASRLVNEQSEEGNGVSKIKTHLSLPFGIVSALVDKVVVGLQTHLDFGEDVLDGVPLRMAVNVHGDRRIVGVNTSFEHHHEVVQVGAVFKNTIDLFVIGNGLLGLD